MSHHSDDLPPEMEHIRHQMRALNQPVGATGAFPLGKLTPRDEGEIRIAIARTPEGKVVIDFGKPVTWIGFTPAQALELAETLRKHVEEIIAALAAIDAAAET